MQEFHDATDLIAFQLRRAAADRITAVETAPAVFDVPPGGQAVFRSFQPFAAKALRIARGNICAILPIVPASRREARCGNPRFRRLCQSCPAPAASSVSARAPPVIARVPSFTTHTEAQAFEAYMRDNIEGSLPGLSEVALAVVRARAAAHTRLRPLAPLARDRAKRNPARTRADYEVCYAAPLCPPPRRQAYVNPGINEIRFGRQRSLSTMRATVDNLPPNPLPAQSVGGGLPGEPFFLPESHLAVASAPLSPTTAPAATVLALSFPGMKDHRTMSGRQLAQDNVLLTGQTSATGLTFVARGGTHHRPAPARESDGTGISALSSLQLTPLLCPSPHPVLPQTTDFAVTGGFRAATAIYSPIWWTEPPSNSTGGSTTGGTRTITAMFSSSFAWDAMLNERRAHTTQRARTHSPPPPSAAQQKSEPQSEGRALATMHRSPLSRSRSPSSLELRAASPCGTPSTSSCGASTPAQTSTPPTTTSRRRRCSTRRSSQ